MRVLHLTAGNLFGGVESLLLTLARQRRLCPEMEPEFGVCFTGRLRDQLRAEGVPVHDLNGVRLSRPWTLWRARRALRRLLSDRRPDVVISHGCWPHVVFAPATDVPTVFWAHDVPAGRHWLERWARLTRPRLVTANSRHTAAGVGVLFPDVPCEVIHPPVAAADTPSAEAARRETRAALDTPADAVVIVTASRLERWKGHPLLLDALGRIADVPGWMSWIAGGAQRPGENDYLDDLKRTAMAHRIGDRVRFLGQRDDVPRLLAAADVHCQPNRGPEPFGIAFVEALAAGLPVVTTALGGALEIVDESCGVMVPPGDAAALAEALRRLIASPAERSRLGAAGPARAALLCDPAARLRQLADFLSRGATGKRAG